jgi:hypothetical protein
MQQFVLLKNTHLHRGACGPSWVLLFFTQFFLQEWQIAAGI